MELSVTTKTNLVERISFSGGLLGLIFGSHRGKLEKVITTKNREGWNLAEVIPDNPNLALILIRLVLLIVTLGLWTIATGYILVFEKPNVSGVENEWAPAVAKISGGPTLRAEPRLK
jgi:hypothetical protein